MEFYLLVAYKPHKRYFKPGMTFFSPEKLTQIISRLKLTESVSDSEMEKVIQANVGHPFTASFDHFDKKTIIIAGESKLAKFDLEKKVVEGNIVNMGGWAFGMAAFKNYVLFFLNQQTPNMKIVKDFGSPHEVNLDRCLNLNLPLLHFNPGKLVTLAKNKLLFISEGKNLKSYDLTEELPKVFSDSYTPTAPILGSQVHDVAYDEIKEETAFITMNGELVVLDKKQRRILKSQIEDPEAYHYHCIGADNHHYLIGACSKGDSSGKPSVVFLVNSKGKITDKKAEFSEGNIKFCKFIDLKTVRIALTSMMYDINTVWIVNSNKLVFAHQFQAFPNPGNSIYTILEVPKKSRRFAELKIIGYPYWFMTVTLSL